ncbi:hypothetical protein IFR05_015390, partial [Cadophora sp. M221]
MVNRNRSPLTSASNAASGSELSTAVATMMTNSFRDRNIDIKSKDAECNTTRSFPRSKNEESEMYKTAQRQNATPIY